MSVSGLLTALASVVRGCLPAMPSQQHGGHDDLSIEKEIVRLLLSIEERIIRMANDFDAKLADIASDVSQLTNVVASAQTAFTGLETQLADALAAAKNSGLSDQQLQQLTDFHTAFSTQIGALSQAIATSTSAAGDTTGGGASGGTTGGGADTTTGGGSPVAGA
jgi:hypothetical protein